MGITTDAIIQMMCKKIKYIIKRTNKNIYILTPIKIGTTPDIMCFFDESTGIIHSNSTIIDIPQLFNECCNHFKI